MQIGKKETTNPFGKTSEVGYFKLQNDGYLALNNTTTGIFSIYLKCTSTGTINIGSDERTISTAWMRYIFYKIPLNCQVLFTQGEYFIYGAKLESGNKVTDWTAAPEDIQNQFTIITNTISGVSSKVDNVEKSIVNKVWQTDITSKINEYNNTTVKEIVDRVTKTETDINGVSTTVSTMKTNYDGQITSLETKQIQTDSKLGWLVSSGTSSSDFTLTDRTADLVSKYINLHGLVTFKGLSSDVNGKFTKYDGWGGTTDSTKINGAMIETGSIKAEQIAANAITAIKIAANAVTADKISAYGLSVLHKTTGVKTLEIDASGNVNLNVNSLQIASKDVPTKTEVTQSIKDLQIGGRNLLLNSADLTKWDQSVGPAIPDSDGYFKVTYDGSSIWWGTRQKVTLKVGQTYTLSGWCKGNAARLYAYANETDQYCTEANTTSTGKFLSVTFTPKQATSFYIICYAKKGIINYYKLPKLERGNKATDWTPAPEDLTADAQAKAAEALASAKTYADAQIKVAADSISQNVSKVQAASIISSQEQFYQSTSSTSLTGGSWSNTQPAWASGKYIWRRTLVTYGNNKTGYTPSETGVCITGNTGATGSTGLKALQPLKSFTGTYTTIGSTASENVTSFNRTPVVGDTFINLDASSNTGTWQVTTVSNGTATFKLLSCVSSKGAKGDPGATGKGIKSTAVTYQASSSGTTVPTGTWVTSVPVTDAVNPYLWTRTVITYTDNTKSTSYAVGSTLEGVSVGGRNLILNGKGDKKAGFFKNFTTVTDEYGEFTLTSKKEWVNIDIGGGFLLGCRDYTVGEQVTWSYDIMYTAWNFPSGTDRNEFWIGQRYTNAPSGETATGTWTGVTFHVLPVVGQNGCELNKWFHVKKTLTIPKQASSNVGTVASIQFYNSNANVAASFTARLKNVKLERGNVATDWTPAPEDLATADNVNDKLTELRKEVNSNIEQTGEAIKSSVYEKVYLKDDVDTLLSSVNTEVEQTKTSWQVTFNQLVKQLNDYSDGSDAAFDEIRKYIRFEDGNILLGNSSSPLILRIRNNRIQFLQNGYEVAYISDQRMYNTTCEIINQLRIADSAWTVEYNASGDTVISLVGI